MEKFEILSNNLNFECSIQKQDQLEFHFFKINNEEKKRLKEKLILQNL